MKFLRCIGTGLSDTHAKHAHRTFALTPNKTPAKQTECTRKNITVNSFRNECKRQKQTRIHSKDK